MPELPSGTVTFLFSDLEGSSRLWEEHPEGMKAALARHDEILRAAIERHGGYVVKMRGDGVHAAFATADAAVVASVAIQHGLSEEVWDSTGPLRVRIGIHTGAASLRDGDYFGSSLNRAARLMDLAHGSQIVCSQSTADLARDALSEGVELVDLGEHRLRDLTRAERVFQVTAPALASDFGPLRSLDAFAGNLPVQVTSFVGRSEELARVREELSQARLLTLTGVGGVGKTRLALEVAADVVPEFGDGAWLVELAGVRDPDAVPDAVVALFALQPRAGLSQTEALLEFLRSKKLLLVLDNCEHLLRPAASLVDQIVRTCPEVRVLATSREGLGVGGERMFAVSSLDVPDEGASLEQIGACDGVVLFVERARAVKASFALDAANSGAVAQVCRRLDGIALAIELAAARVAMLTPSDLARRLDQRFRVLAGGQRSVVERHQTLRAMIDWSYELLSDAQQLLLARLSIFVGGFTLEAAEAVCSGGAVEVDAVFEELAALVARSLVVADTEDFDARYRLLETIRQYAQERLDDGGDTDRLRAAHAVYYADFGERAVASTTGPDGIEWERRVEREFDNLRVALTWAVDTQDVDSAVRLLAMWDAPFLFAFFIPASMVDAAAEAVRALPGATAHPRYPSALVVAAYSTVARGDHELAERLCDETLAAEQRLGTEPSIGLWLVRTLDAQFLGHGDDMVDHAVHAVMMARDRGDSTWLIQALSYSSMARALEGDAAAAFAEAEEVLAIRHRLADTRAVLMTVGLAAWAMRDREPERALALGREMVGLAAADSRSANWVMLGDIAAYLGQRRDALGYFDKAIDSVYVSGMQPTLRAVLALIATLLAGFDPEPGAVLFGAADALGPGFAHTRHHMDAREQAITNLQTSLGQARYAELYAEGTTMNSSDASQYAHTAIRRNLGDDRSD